MRHTKLTRGALALALSLAALWGGNPVALKAGLRDCPPLRLGWLRFAIGGAVVAAVALARKQTLRIESHEWTPLLTLGLLFSVQVGLMNVGQSHTSAGHATVILSSYPLWASVFAHFFVPGDRLTVRRSVGALVAYGGVLIVFRGNVENGASHTLLGDGLLATSAVLLAARQIVLSRFAQGIAIEKLLMSQATLGFGTFLLTSVLFESQPTSTTPRLAASLFYQGVIIAGIAFLLQTWLLKNFPPSRVSTVYLAQPIFGVFASWLVLGEAIGPELYLGAPLVVVGSYFVQRSS